MTLHMYALLTNQGTAAGESALCSVHHADSVLRDEARVLASAGGDIDVTQPFADCTGNDALQCIACETPDDDSAVVELHYPDGTCARWNVSNATGDRVANMLGTPDTLKC